MEFKFKFYISFEIILYDVFSFWISEFSRNSIYSFQIENTSKSDLFEPP